MPLVAQHALPAVTPHLEVLSRRVAVRDHLTRLWLLAALEAMGPTVVAVVTLRRPVESLYLAASLEATVLAVLVVAGVVRLLLEQPEHLIPAVTAVREPLRLSRAVRSLAAVAAVEPVG